MEGESKRAGRPAVNSALARGSGGSHQRFRSVKIRSFAFGLVALCAGGCAGLSAQDVIVGQPSWFVTKGAPDRPPRARKRMEVHYPASLRDSDRSGYVILARYVDKHGVGLMMDADATQPRFKSAVEDALERISMRPATLAGRPVSCWFWTPIIFDSRATAPGRPNAPPRLLAVAPVIVPGRLQQSRRRPVGIRGTIRLDAAGVPQHVTLAPTAPRQLLPFVEASLKRWRFAPARKNGRAVPAEFSTTFFLYPAMAPIPRAAELPRPVRQVQPIYPYEMRKNFISGEVNVGFVVNRKGRVTNAVVISSTSPDFDDAALKAVRQWRFRPGMVDGHPVDTQLSVPIVFNFTGGGGRQEVGVRQLGWWSQKRLPKAIRYDVAPRVREFVQPVYPYALLLKDVSGKATVDFVINPKGRVVALKVAKATRPAFGLALAAAVQRYAFTPALRHGRPTTTILKMEEDFSRYKLTTSEDRTLLREEEKHPEKIVDLGHLDTPVRPRLTILPMFPLALRGKLDHGSAMIEILIDRDGNAHLPRIVEASNPAFGYAAAQAVSTWSFTPPKKNGRPVVARVIIPFKFKTKPPVMGTAVGVPKSKPGRS